MKPQPFDPMAMGALLDPEVFRPITIEVVPPIEE